MDHETERDHLEEQANEADYRRESLAEAGCAQCGFPADERLCDDCLTGDDDGYDADGFRIGHEIHDPRECPCRPQGCASCSGAAERLG
jgi:hypothetical protein